MKRIYIVLLVIIAFSASCCADRHGSSKEMTTVNCSSHLITDEMTKKDNKMRYILFDRITRATVVGDEEDIDEIEGLLNKGLDPNICVGESGWMDTNPLMVVARSCYTTCYRIEQGIKIPNPTPDVRILAILIGKGADIKRFPYVWIAVNENGNALIESVKNQWESDHKHMGATKEQLARRIENTIEDSNRLIEAFILAGADPAMKGDPYPFSQDAGIIMNDELALQYFSKGTLPINEAIAKGSMWQSQVDLLLKYTKLDDNSLAVAKKTNDERMISKIANIWKNQEGAELAKDTP